MDAWFLLFVFTIAIGIAAGGALALAGYIGLLPASLNFGWRNWLPATSGVLALVAGYFASQLPFLDFNWRLWGGVTALLATVGPLWFAWRNRSEFAKPGKQLLIGALLLVAAIGLLYGAGPHFIERMAAGIK
ncbi:MAG: hypothetical protein LBV49_05555 [Azonexus sp.]|jgi:hypothetical protein|nr:hypothetical protein [Azonexus sp.]